MQDILISKVSFFINIFYYIQIPRDHHWNNRSLHSARWWKKLNDLAPEQPKEMPSRTYQLRQLFPSIIKSHAWSPNERDGSVNRPESTLWTVAKETGSNEENWNFISIRMSFRDEFPYHADPPQVVYLSADRRPFGQTWHVHFPLCGIF